MGAPWHVARIGELTWINARRLGRDQHDPVMDHLFSSFGALCSPDAPLGVAGTVLALLLAGLVGSAAHCAPMCGPFVLAQVSANWARLTPSQLCPRQRLRQGMLLPYHLGRLSTYAVLGALAAGTGGAVARVPGLRMLPGVLLLIGAVMLLAPVIRRLAPAVAGRWLPGDGGASWFAPLAERARGIDRDTVPGAYLFGVVLGFLPCGLLYAALAVSAGTQHPGMGALAMAAFWLGTTPALVTLGVLGQALGRGRDRLMQRAGLGLALLNALMLAAMGLQRLLVSLPAV